MQNEEPILQPKQVNCKPSCKLSPKKALNPCNWDEKNKIQRRELCDPQTISSNLNSSEKKAKFYADLSAFIININTDARKGTAVKIKQEKTCNWHLNWEGRRLQYQMIWVESSSPRKRSSRARQGRQVQARIMWTEIPPTRTRRAKNGDTLYRCSCVPRPSTNLPKGYYTRGERRRSQGHKWSCWASIPPTKNPKRTKESETEERNSQQSEILLPLSAFLSPASRFSGHYFF